MLISNVITEHKKASETTGLLAAIVGHFVFTALRNISRLNFPQGDAAMFFLLLLIMET